MLLFTSFPLKVSLGQVKDRRRGWPGLGHPPGKGGSSKTSAGRGQEDEVGQIGKLLSYQHFILLLSFISQKITPNSSTNSSY